MVKGSKMIYVLLFLNFFVIVLCYWLLSQQIDQINKIKNYNKILPGQYDCDFVGLEIDSNNNIKPMYVVKTGKYRGLYII